MRDPLNTQVERLLDVRGFARLSRVACEPQARGARGLERGALRRRRITDLIAGEIEADHAHSREAPCLERERDVVLGRVLPHGAHDGDSA